ncbi:Eukaryotic peptide chain release factor subunit 1-3 [Capsicum chinense]|nr:Eukaryotic peptide chain release factor subunit 1-3 [Capsicum chinense]
MDPLHLRHLNKEQDTVRTLFPDPNTNIELEIQDNYDYMTGFVNEYRIFGCNLEFITTKSQEGSQFSRGLDGIGGILRYQLDVRAFDNLSDDGEIYEDSE